MYKPLTRLIPAKYSLTFEQRQGYGVPVNRDSSKQTVKDEKQ